MAADWSAISDVVELPVQHATVERDIWSLREFCKAIYTTEVSLTVDELLSRAAHFKAFEDPAAKRFESGLHRELRSLPKGSLDYAAFAAIVDDVLDTVAEEMNTTECVPDLGGYYDDADHDAALQD